MEINSLVNSALILVLDSPFSLTKSISKFFPKNNFCLKEIPLRFHHPVSLCIEINDSQSWNVCSFITKVKFYFTFAWCEYQNKYIKIKAWSENHTTLAILVGRYAWRNCWPSRQLPKYRSTLVMNEQTLHDWLVLIYICGLAGWSNHNGISFGQKLMSRKNLLNQ